MFLLFLRIDDVIRCFCNLPRCVSTSYMCQTARSSSGGCFSELRSSDAGDSVPKHGCIEILQEEYVPFCSQMPFNCIAIHSFIFSFSFHAAVATAVAPIHSVTMHHENMVKPSMTRWFCAATKTCAMVTIRNVFIPILRPISTVSLSESHQNYSINQRSLHSIFGVLNFFFITYVVSPWVPQSVRLLMCFHFVGVRKLR